jgi:hypothetical protein
MGFLIYTQPTRVGKPVPENLKREISPLFKHNSLQQCFSNLAHMNSVADTDPGSGAFLTPWIWDPRWVKNQDPDS